jgi:UDP-N-acetylglucosamine transferase subunit ALG13
VIFATVGTQLPFPRLVAALDRIATAHKLAIFVQSSDPNCGCTSITCKASLAPAEFDEQVRNASILVGHAGIGTVLTAKKLGKPLIVFPRKASLNEHRNDHQVATARSLEAMNGIHVAWDEESLERLITTPDLEPAGMEHHERRAKLIARIRDFI